LESGNISIEILNQVSLDCAKLEIEGLRESYLNIWNLEYKTSILKNINYIYLRSFIINPFKEDISINLIIVHKSQNTIKSKYNKLNKHTVGLNFEPISMLSINSLNSQTRNYNQSKELNNICKINTGVKYYKG
jgi:hypothetical protein